ncbi:MAG: flavodoxin family protein [Beijerinckiaceae bacterium]
MTTVAIVYFSGYGHTHVLAEEAAAGVAKAGATPKLLRIENASQNFDNFLAEVAKADAVIFGSPTYMGDVAAGLKAFFEASAKPWMGGEWSGKIAGGFTNGLTFGGNKDNTLGSMFVLAMQHGMIWVGTGQPAGNMSGNSDAAPTKANRLGYAIGAVAQSDNAGPDVTPPSGDKETVRLYGERIAQFAAKLAK